MESEPLESCPICRGPVVLDGPSNPDASRDVVWPNCIDDFCPYMLDGGIPAVVAEAHNTLARRAEIGRLVEDVLSKTGYFQVEEESDEHGRMYDVRTQERSSYTDTLLDALRSLAAEIGGKNA